MKLLAPLLAPINFVYSAALMSRRLLPRQKCRTFGPSASSRIGSIYVINLDRQQDRWVEISRELGLILDAARRPLTDRATRCSAIDARVVSTRGLAKADVDPIYTLRDQLWVEPQPLAMPDRIELDRPVRMSAPEIAVASSHIMVWRTIAAGAHEYSLVLEDDVVFSTRFARHLDRAWSELFDGSAAGQDFDILYLSYAEVKGGAPKVFVSPTVFCPQRGLWCLSGYVLSQKGAKKLLSLLPCRGPVDLWLNHMFPDLTVRATRRSIIGQRRDGISTNSYSILPALTRIGILASEGESLFKRRPPERPVIAVGSPGSGLTSLAMALSMLGYRCCSDVTQLPRRELDCLLSGSNGRVFDAFVNVGCLSESLGTIRNVYPQAKFIVTTRDNPDVDTDVPDALSGAVGMNVAILPTNLLDKWKLLCEHLRCPPPVAAFPELPDIGQRELLCGAESSPSASHSRTLKWDSSPWIVQSSNWRGVPSQRTMNPQPPSAPMGFTETFHPLHLSRFVKRQDTFGGNLALFRSENVTFVPEGAALLVKAEPLRVRDYSAGSLSSIERFLYGRFEAVLQATNVPGIVTGFFLHRDSPRQEIDVEIVGGRSDSILLNVFYNPGGEGATFDYGYRGTPIRIMLGFDASAAVHRYAIEWLPDTIRWFVDDLMVHERANWNPTPIPHLPMTLHLNCWPSRSIELAGRLRRSGLPANALVRSVSFHSS